MSNIPIIGEKPQEQPTYPRTEINVTPQGWFINIEFAPLLKLSHVITRADLQELIKMQNNLQQQELMMQRAARHALDTKL